jgi:hypothetical protein
MPRGRGSTPEYDAFESSCIGLSDLQLATTCLKRYNVHGTLAKENIMAIAVAWRTWLERLEANRFDDWTKEHMIKEMPHTYFLGYLPIALAFLRGRFVDLGFENLGLSAPEYRASVLGFGGSGVCIPGTQLRMRFAYPHAVIEPVDGSEKATLPTCWKEGVLVVDDRGVPTWVGKKACHPQVRPPELHSNPPEVTHCPAALFRKCFGTTSLTSPSKRQSIGCGGVFLPGVA